MSFLAPEDELEQEFFTAPEDELLMEDTGQNRASAMGMRMARDAAGVIPSTIGGIGALSEGYVRTLNPVAWAAMAGVPGAQSLVDLAAKPGEFLSSTVADSTLRGIESVTPVNPLFEQSFENKAAGAVGQAGGQLVSMLIPAKVLSLGPAATRAYALSQAGAIGAKSGADTSESYGITDPVDKMLMTYGFGGAEAITESLGGIGGSNWTRSFINRAKNAVKPGSGIVRFGKTAGIEGVEEIVAGEAQDQLTKAIVDEDPLRPGYSTAGVPLPPDMFTMENLYNRLEEGALGAIGGTVFAGAEALRGRTGVNEAFSLRMEAKNRLDELAAIETRTPEEEAELAQIVAEDTNLSAWLERQGAETIRPALDQIINNPEASETDRRQATEYASLLDSLQAVENAPDVTPEEIQAARTAVDNHPLNGINRLSRANQNDSIRKTSDERRKELAAKVDEQIRRERPGEIPASTQLEEAEEILDVVAPATAAAVREVVAGIEPTGPKITRTATVEGQTLEQTEDGKWWVNAAIGLPAPPGLAVPTEVSITQDGSPLVDDATGMTSENYRINGTQGNATVRIQGNNAFLKDIQIGEEDSGSRGKGIGTKAYEALGNLLAGRGITLQSTRGSHGTTISPAALRIWQKLAERGLAMQTGMEDTRVYDRSGKDLGIHAIPTYDFINPAQNVTPNQTSATASLTPATAQAAASMGVQPETAAVAEPVTDTIIPAEEVTAPTDATYPPIPQQQTSAPDAAQQVPVAESPQGGTTAGTGVSASSSAPSPQLDYPFRQLPNQLNSSPLTMEDAAEGIASYLKDNPERAPLIKDTWIGTTAELAQNNEVRKVLTDRSNQRRSTPMSAREAQTNWDIFLNSPHEAFKMGERAYILLDKVVVTMKDVNRAARLGLTPEQFAMRRLMAHEDRHLLTDFIESDPVFGKRFREIANQIAPEDLDSLARRRYPEFSDWRTSEINKRKIQLEWFSEQAEMEVATHPSLLEKFMQWLREAYAKILGVEPQDVDDLELRDFLKKASLAQSREATGLGGDIRASQPDSYNYPPRPDSPVAFTDWIPSVNQEQALQLAWESFYRDQINQGVQPDQISEAWATEAADPESYFVAQGMTDAFMEARKKPADVYSPAPSQTAPETGPQFSQPELTPEQKLQRLKEIHAELSYATFHTEKEGLDPTLATRMEREFANSGRDVRFYRKSLSDIERRALAEEELNLLISMSPDGPSQDFGNKLVTYLNGVTPDIFGDEGNDLSKVNLINYLLKSPQDRGQMGIDAEELERARSKYLSESGALLRTAAADRIYGPLRAMETKANEQTDDAAKKNLGTDDFKGLADQVNEEVVQGTLPLADDVAAPGVMGAAVDSAQIQADTADFEAAISSLPPNEQKAVIDLLNELEELDELLRLEAELTAGQTGPAASRAEIRSQKLTLEQVRAKIAAKRKNITKLVEEIQKAKVEGDPVEAAQKVVKRVRKPKTAPPEQNNRLRDWASGKLEVEGLGKPAKLIQKYINGAGLNRLSLTTVLTNAFPEADPTFITALVGRIGDLVDGVATRESILEDIKQGGGKPDPKLVEKMVKIADRARKARENAVKSMEKKLAKVKNPTATKLRQRSTFVNSIMGAMETGILDSDAVRAAFAEAYDLHGLTPERLKEMGDLLQKIESLKEGMVKESFLLEFNSLLNSLAPTASFVTHAHSALMGYVLSGVGTMAMQLTGVNRYINPLAGTVEVLWSAPGTTAEKLGRTINPKNFFRIYMQGMKEVGENLQQGIAGLSGVKTSVGQGLGAIPSSLAAVTPRETSLSYTPFGQISKYRFNTPKLLKAMGLDKLVQATRYPAFMVSRSFQVIRAAEGIIGGADKNMQFRAQMTYALMQADPKLSFNQAYSKVSDALGDKTSEMWQDAYKQVDAEIANKGPVNKWSRKQRATELVQDALEEKWAKNLANRPREIAALYGYKQDPITPLGAWLYKGVSGVLNKDKGPLQALKFSFLFARFFTNAIETAYSRTPLGGLGAMFIDTAKSEGRLDEREKRIIQMFGSLQGYKDARIARSVSGTAVMGGIAGLMVMALKGWDPDDDEPPFFWITGDPIGEFSKKGSMEAGGWWKANTLYIGPVRINYVNASPEYAIALSAMGSTGDRFMFDKLLNYKENKETGEYERSNYQAYGKPVIEAMAAPISRSTFRQWYDMLEAAYDGDFTKLTKAVSNPAVGTAVALSPAGLIPSIKTLEKIDRSSEQPRTAKTPSQAAMGSVPFADELGLDAGKPLTTPFGNPLTPYPFWSVLSNSQEVPPEVSRAARTLTDLGVSRLGPREEYFGWGMAEIASGGKKYLLGDSERGKVLQDIGRRFASKINNNSQRLRRLEKEKDGRNKVRDAISDLASKARAEALYNYKPTR